MTSYKVGYLVGSLAKASINRLLATALERLARPQLQMRRSRSRTSLFTATTTTRTIRRSPPRSRIRLPRSTRSVRDAQYNRSIPGGLKNAIDWASRPYGTNAFARKPSGIIGTSPGKIGTAIAQQHLRSILAFCNSPLMNSIEAYVQFERGLITDDGRVTDATTEQFLRQYMEEFAAFIARVYTVLPRNQ